MSINWRSISVTIVLSFWISLAAAEDSSVRVLFDQGHNQRFLIEEKDSLHLSGMADIIRGQSTIVKSTKSPLSDDNLRGNKGLIISGPFEALLPEEVEAVLRYMESGGRLAAMLHIGQPLAGLLARLDVDHSNRVLHERQNVIDTDINFRVKGLTPDPLLSGIRQFSAYGAWALNPGTTAKSIARTSSEAWMDLDGDKILSQGDVIGSFSLLVRGTYGAGGFIIFGDDAIFQNRFLDEDNRKLASNLASWLAGR